jgi:hypothetical protein
VNPAPPTSPTAPLLIFYGGAALVLAASAGLVTAAVWLYRRLRQRRADLDYEAGVADRVHDRRFLEWLDEQFDAEGRVR